MADAQLLELRLFTVKPGLREEFGRVSREGTVPLMRKLGITVVAHGPSLYDEDTYYLLRAFDDEEQRVSLGASLYEQPEWEQYDEPVGAMMAAYSTVVFPMSTEAVKHMAEFGA